MEDFASSHRLRLSLRQWAAVGVFTLVLLLAAPRVWRAVEPFEAGPTWRMPYELSQDYGLWARRAERAVEAGDTLLIGDSVIWGQYVRPGETLSDQLSALSGTPHANLGVNGMQPAVLAGLIEHYGTSIRGRDVLLHCNPLWMSSPKHDLREDEALINHAQLLPQFSPRIRGYKDEVEARLGRIVDRNLPFRAWTNHLQAAYFESEAIPAWTRKHPRENPLARVTLRIPAPETTLHQSPIPWFENGKPVDFPWMSLEESFQWTRFVRALKILESRGNNVVVIVGPFNEHMCKPASLERYVKLRDAILWKLSRELNVPVIVPGVLPSETYGDASHPLARGYELLARQILEKKR